MAFTGSRHAGTLLACVVATLVVVLAPAPEEAAAGSSALDRVERKIIRKVNAIRRDRGLGRLRADRRLARSADYHCRDMLRANFFAHESSNGQSFAQRLQRFRPSRRLGETLAYVAAHGARGQAARVVRMWMQSPPHRAALLSSDFQRIGVARRTGRLGSARTIVFTADLSSRR